MSKRLAFETAMDKGKTRLVFLMEHPEVDVPESAGTFSEDGKFLALDYSHHFQNARINVTDRGVTAHLSFNGKRHKTFVPWAAVAAMFQDDVLLEQWGIKLSPMKHNPWHVMEVAEG